MVDASLTFLGEKFSVLSELAGEVGVLPLRGQVVVAVVRQFVVLASVLLVVGTVVVRLLVRLWRGSISVGDFGRCSNGAIFLPFPIMTINFEGEVAEFGEAFVSRKVKQVVLDMLGQTPIGDMPEGRVVPLGSGRTSGKLNEVAGGPVVFFHNGFF